MTAWGVGGWVGIAKIGERSVIEQLVLKLLEKLG